MKKISFIILIFILHYSCNVNTSDNTFQKQIFHFDKKIIEHFPSTIPRYYTSAVFEDNQNDVTNILLKIKYDEDKYKIIKDSLVALSKVNYKSNDSCLLVVNMYSNEKNYFNSFKTNDETYLKKDCLKQKLPIPNFWALDYNTKNITKLPDDYKIYVFDAKKDTLDSKYLSKNVYMPSYWKHGNSKGVAINDKTNEIIYWFVLW